MESSHSRTLNPQNNRGFSLLELVAVIAILSILVVITLGVMDAVRERSIRSRTEAELATIRGALEVYRLDFSSYPIVSSGNAADRSTVLLEALLGDLDPDGNGISRGRQYLNPKVLTLNESGDQILDGWGNPIYYSFREDWKHQHYFLISAGSDGIATYPDSDGQYEAALEQNLDNLEGLDL